MNIAALIIAMIDNSLTDVITYTNLLIDIAELPSPCCMVEKMSVIVSVVIRTVAFGVIRWRQRRHLMAVDGVTPEKVFHLLGNLLSHT